uniref:EF-hand domain-containing protein n=1 Tax=Alexandrium catenella TaxID=2925 RepID=A0A7S1SCA2_ALECA|mmetsp:Transcript_92675/g.246203  ORF Transcript_92675/g.246203 Transcript_92675/m.246203 type:complete len:116 (+) Transcript_92675:74-421(+)
MVLSAEKKQKLRSRFAALNKNGDKFLDFREIGALLRKGNPDMTDKELKLLYDDIDKNRDGKVNFDEFVEYLYPGEGLRTGEGMRGPERFFYDPKTYTGMHAREELDMDAWKLARS